MTLLTPDQIAEIREELVRRLNAACNCIEIPGACEELLEGL